MDTQNLATTEPVWPNVPKARRGNLEAEEKSLWEKLSQVKRRSSDMAIGLRMLHR